MNDNENRKILNGKSNNILSLKVKSYNDDKINLINYISFAKMISSFGVVTLHINGGFWSYNISKKKKWIVQNLYETLFYYSVPFFVLCICATLLNFRERYGLYEYNKKRIIKVFVPLVGWTFILYFYKVYILKNIRKESFNYFSLWNYFFSSKLYPIYNSLHEFLKTYMLIPLFAYVEKSIKLRIYTYFFILLITQSIIPYLITLFANKMIYIYKINIGYMIYIFAGYIIHNHNFSRLSKKFIYILGIFSFFIHLLGTNILTFRYNRIITIHKGYLNLPCILYSCSFFIFIKNYSYLFYNIIDIKYINIIGSLTLGPFFIHLAVKETIDKFFKFDELINYSVLLSSFIIFSICLFISAILKKIPILKILVP